MSTPKLSRLMSQEELVATQQSLVELVRRAMAQRGTMERFYDAVEAARVGGRPLPRVVRRSLSEAAERLPDDTLRLLVELAHTASVMELRGEFPMPDEGQTTANQTEEEPTP